MMLILAITCKVKRSSAIGPTRRARKVRDPAGEVVNKTVVKEVEEVSAESKRSYKKVLMFVYQYVLFFSLFL